jgi:hypothetical protein
VTGAWLNFLSPFHPRFMCAFFIASKGGPLVWIRS